MKLKQNDIKNIYNKTRKKFGMKCNLYFHSKNAINREREITLVPNETNPTLDDAIPPLWLRLFSPSSRTL